MKETFLKLTDVFRITNRTEENIRLKIAAGLINKYDRDGNKLSNPLQETGYFKLSEVLNVYNIQDYESVKQEFLKKRIQPDSVIENIIPESIVICNNLPKLKKLPSHSIDTCISFFPYDPRIRNKPYKTNPDRSYVIESHKEWIKEVTRILNERGNYLIHSTPELLPYYGVYLDKFMHFKYWLVSKAEILPPDHDDDVLKRLSSVTNGTLFYLKTDKGFRINRIRETFRCEYCGRNIKDYGGKKHLIHHNGAIISDVWKYISSPSGVFSDQLLARLINLSCDTDSKLLLTPFPGDLHARYRA
ncbi:MAG: hypothetical protein ACFFFG_01065 [Candidatus Thorarchaeota archaeon]